MNGMVGSKAKAMSLPVVHLQIIDELGMGIGILNLPMCFNESFNVIQIALGFHSGANIVIEAGQAQVSFILDDHVVQNHTTVGIRSIENKKFPTARTNNKPR
jgi:hypothetical protein